MNNLVTETSNKIDNHRESSDFRVIWELTRIIYVHDPGGTNNNTLDTSEDRGEEGDLRNLNPPNSTRKADFNTTGRQFFLYLEYNKGLRTRRIQSLAQFNGSILRITSSTAFNAIPENSKSIG